MSLRALTPLLVAAAALADSAGAHALGGAALVAAVPCAAIGALLSLGLALDLRSPAERLRTALGAAGLGLLLVAAAARAPLVGAEEPPALASTALVLCLAALALDALVAGAAAFRSAREPALGEGAT